MLSKIDKMEAKKRYSKRQFLAILEIDGERLMYAFKAVDLNGVLRQIKKKRPTAKIVNIYPEPSLFDTLKI